MNRVFAAFIIVAFGALTSAAQVAQPPATQAAVGQVNPAATSTPAAAATPQGGVGWINLGSGELSAPQAVTAPTASVAPATRQPSLVGSSITPIQFQNINRIAVELNTLSTPLRDPSAQQRALVETLHAAPVGTVKPSGDMINQLGQSLAQVLPTLDLTAAQRRQLAIDLNLALNSGTLSAAEAERVMADARALLAGSTVNNSSGVEQIMHNFASIISDTQARSGQQASGSSTNTTTSSQAGQAGTSQTGQGSGTSKNATKSTSNR